MCVVNERYERNSFLVNAHKVGKRASQKTVYPFSEMATQTDRHTRTHTLSAFMCPAGFCFLSFMFTIKAVHSRTRGPYGGDTARTKHFHQTSPFFSLYFPPPPHCCHQPPSFLCYSSSRLLRLVSFSKSSFVLCTSFFSCFCSLTKCCSRLTAETEAA